jgi:hypothetical protein
MTTTVPPGLRDTDLVDALRQACGGAAHGPEDPGYDAARRPWRTSVDQRPRAVAYPADATEVAEVLRVASATGARVVPQGTGHGADRLGDLGDAVLLRTAAMRGVEVDPFRRVVRVGAGALWVDVVDATSPYGLVSLHSTSPARGVTGYSLGGGIGWYGRALGLQVDQLTEVTGVLPDGSVFRSGRAAASPLLRGLHGGRRVGVVTALEMRLHPVTTAYAGRLEWDVREARRVLTRWARWAVDAPDEVTTAFRVVRGSSGDGVPGEARGRDVVTIDGVVLGADRTAERLLAPLRELAPGSDTFGRRPASSLIRLHGDPDRPTPLVSASTVLETLPAEGVEALVALVGPGSGSPLQVELRQLGGALGRANPRGLPARREGAFRLEVGGVATGAASVEQLARLARAVVDELRAGAAGRSALPGPGAHPPPSAATSSASVPTPSRSRTVARAASTVRGVT